MSLIFKVTMNKHLFMYYSVTTIDNLSFSRKLTWPVTQTNKQTNFLQVGFK